MRVRLSTDKAQGPDERYIHSCHDFLSKTKSSCMPELRVDHMWADNSLSSTSLILTSTKASVICPGKDLDGPLDWCGSRRGGGSAGKGPNVKLPAALWRVLSLFAVDPFSCFGKASCYMLLCNASSGRIKWRAQWLWKSQDGAVHPANVSFSICWASEPTALMTDQIYIPMSLRSDDMGSVIPP